MQVYDIEEQRPSSFGELMLEEARNGHAAHRTKDFPGTVALYERAFLEFSARLERLQRSATGGGMHARSRSIPYLQEFVLESLRSGRVLA